LVQRLKVRLNWKNRRDKVRGSLTPDKATNTNGGLVTMNHDGTGKRGTGKGEVKPSHYAGVV